MRLDDLSVGDLLEALGAKTPAPGGGAAAALAGAVGAALARMVVNYSTGRKSLAAHDELHRAALGGLADLERRALALAEADAAAYGRLNELWRLDREDERPRRELQAAARGAIAVPAEAIGLAIELLDVLRELVGRTQPSLASDLAVAGILAEAAARAAAWNVRVNLPLLEDEAERSRLGAEVAGQITRAREACAEIERRCG